MATRKSAGASPEELATVYGVPPGDFIRTRDQLAQRLRGEGRGKAAAVVRALRRPSRSAWAVNQLARRFPDRIEALLAAGDELARAQTPARRGGGAALREASARERELVGNLTQAATSILQAQGSAPGALLALVRSTLHALPTASEEDRLAVRRGMLEHDLEPAPFGLLGAWPGPRTAPGEAARGRAAAEKGDAARRAAAERKHAARRAAAERKVAARRAAAEKKDAARRAAAGRRLQAEVGRLQAAWALADRAAAASERIAARAGERARIARERARKAKARLEEARGRLETSGA